MADFLLLETSDYLLKESDGDKLILESSGGASTVSDSITSDAVLKKPMVSEMCQLGIIHVE